MGARGSALMRIVCWYCAHEWMTRGHRSARCPSCRTLNHAPKRALSSGVA
jgi:hypothetical protein